MSRPQAMHKHSIAAYCSEGPQMAARSREIIEWIREHGRSTDRRVMRGLGFTDPNKVRPRITELIKDGVLRDVASERDFDTGKTVRVVDLIATQRDLFA